MRDDGGDGAGVGEMGPGGRLAVLDMARGAALVAMIGYHLSWDLGFLGFVGVDASTHPVGVAAARLIAGTFLFLVGVGLVLAHGGGLRPGPFLRRIALVAGAALGITLATYLVFPGAYIFFGILHAIALFSVLGLPFLRLPVPAVALAAAGVLALPWLWRSSLFDPRALAWIGLFETPPPTVDFEPLFPWFGVTLLGIAAARLALASRLRARLAARRARGPGGRGLAWLGRRSLPVYLVHQPVLLAVLYPLSLLPPVQEHIQARAFIDDCAATCIARGTPGAPCRAACACAAGGLRGGDLWRRLNAGALTPDEEGRVIETTRACFREVEGARP